MITLEDLLNVKMDLDTFKEGCLSSDKKIYFFKYLAKKQLNPEIYNYIVAHDVKECMELEGAIEGAKNLKESKPQIWDALKDTVFSP